MRDRLAISRILSALFFLALLITGCSRPAPLYDLPGPPAALCQGTAGETRVFQGADGAELGYRAYVGSGPETTTALIYLHGIESHAGWFDCAARLLRDQGYDVFCLDRRGSGINRENRGFISGHIDNYETFFADIRTLRDSLARQYQHIFLVGLSWGGKLAYAYGLQYDNDFDGIILITPGLVARVDVSLPTKLAIAAASFIKPTTGFDLPIKTEMFTRTPRYMDWINNDPLRNHQASAKFLMESNRMDRFIRQKGTTSNQSIQLFLAGNDVIIDNNAVTNLLTSTGTNEVSLVLYQDQTHSIQFDATQSLAHDMDLWIQKHNAEESR